VEGHGSVAGLLIHGQEAYSIRVCVEQRHRKVFCPEQSSWINPTNLVLFDIECDVKVSRAEIIGLLFDLRF